MKILTLPPSGVYHPFGGGGAVRGIGLEHTDPLPYRFFMIKSPFQYFKTSPEIIQMAVMMYVRYRDMPLARNGKYVARDTEIKGFMVVVSKKAKSWAVQRDLWQGPRGQRRLVKTVRHTLGRVGIMPLRIAREKALETINLIQKGLDPNHLEPIAENTLRRAWDEYVEAMVAKGRAERSIHGFKYNLRYFEDWADRTLAEIGSNRSLMRERHKELTRKNGPYTANHAMRAMRSAYNLALKVDDDLPANPVVAVTFNKESKRQVATSLPSSAIQILGESSPATTTRQRNRLSGLTMDVAFKQH